MILYQYIQSLFITYSIYRKRFYFELFKDKYLHPDKIYYERIDFSKYKFKYIKDKNYLKINKIDNNIIIIIDNFFKDLSFLDVLKKQQFYTDPSNFPGYRININEKNNLVKEINSVIFYISKKYFNMKCFNGNLFLQYPTYKNKDLTNYSIFPHKDDHPLAINCFLFKKNKMYGGTSMYKKIPFDLNKPYNKNYLKNLSKNKRYCSDFQEKIFKNIFYIRNKFNRLVIFKGSSVWHQGIIDYKYFHNNFTEDKPKRYCLTGFYR